MTFCKYCGTQLADGQVCTCPGAVNEANAAAQAAPQAPYQAAPQAPYQPAPGAAPMGGGYYAPAAPKAPSAFGTAMKDVWNLFLNLFKKPASATAEFIQNGTRIHAFIMIGIQAILFGILAICFAGKHNGFYDKLAAGIPAAAVAYQPYMINVFVAFLMGVIGAVIVYALLAVILLAFVKMFKGNTNFDTMLKTSAVSAYIAAPFILVAILLSLILTGYGAIFDFYAMQTVQRAYFQIMIPWSLVIAFVGCVIGNLMVFSGLSSACDLDKDKQLYVKFFTGIVMAIAIFLLVRYIILPMCIPEIIKADWTAHETSMTTTLIGQ